MVATRRGVGAHRFLAAGAVAGLAVVLTPLFGAVLLRRPPGRRPVTDGGQP